MHKKTIIFVILAAFLGAIGGFWLANSINRSAINAITPEKSPAAASVSSNSAQASEEPDLTPEEIAAKIAQADKNPTDFAYQKTLGTALYGYAATKQDPDLLDKSVRILERANSLSPKDFDVLVALGNAHFDLGFAHKDLSQYQRAREIYAKALATKPDDADVQTDLGLTYFLQEPPEFDKAAAQLKKVTDANPKHTRSLQFLTRVYLKQNKLNAAEDELEKLKSLDPTNSAIPDLTAQLLAARSSHPAK